MLRSAFLLLLTATLGLAQAPAAKTAPQTPDWVKRSNALATKVLTVQADLNPEASRQSGLDGYEDKITDFGPGLEDRQDKAGAAAMAIVKDALATEKDPLVREDLEIMRSASSRTARDWSSIANTNCPISTCRSSSSAACKRCSMIK